MDYNNFEDGYAETGIGRVHYKFHRTQENERSIIFIPGLGGTTRVWTKLLQHLDNDMDVYLIDLFGHGRSDAPDIRYTIAEQTQAISGVVKSAGLRRYSLFGHSYGGWVAAYFEAMSNNAEALVLEDSAGLKEYIYDIKNSGMANEHRNMVLDFVKRSEGDLTAMNRIMDNDYNDAEILTSSVLARIGRPTLVLWGDRDAIIDPKYAVALSKHIRNSTLRIIPDAGHNPHYERPEPVAEALRVFVGSQRRMKNS